MCARACVCVCVCVCVCMYKSYQNGRKIKHENHFVVCLYIYLNVSLLRMFI